MSSKIRAIVVDDEQLGREALKEVLSEIDAVEVVAECNNGFEAVQEVHKQKPDLVFLDIQMPKLDGFDVVELLGDDAPIIVFVTAYDEYALRAFEAAALDYLVKPVQPERLERTLQRVREGLQGKKSQPVAKLINHHQSEMAPLSRILIRDGMEVFIIPSEDIIYIEAQDDYVMVYTTERSHLKYDRMNKLEKTLDPQYFCRIHRSYLINVRYLKKIEPYSKDSRLAIMQNNQKLPISRAGYNRLLELL
jgi:two-component system LytT family response regulator